MSHEQKENDEESKADMQRTKEFQENLRNEKNEKPGGEPQVKADRKWSPA